jgi:hypothetical protein
MKPKPKAWPQKKPASLGTRHDANDRHHLIAGPSSPPLIPKNGLLRCELRGRLPVGDYSQAPIPWPMRQGKHSIILCGDLVRAVRQESVEAISYHWNVSRALVQAWRKALKVPEFNPGTRRLRAAVEELRKPIKRSRYLDRWRHPNRKLPRRAPYPPELRRPAASAVLKAQFARTRHHPNPDLILWTAKEEKLLGTASDEVVAAKLKRTPGAVRARRNLLGIPTHLRRYIKVWTPEEDRHLGTKSDQEIAGLLRRSIRSIKHRRFQLGIPNPHPLKHLWTPSEDQLLGTRSDQEVARMTSRSASAVQQRRLLLKLPLSTPRIRPWEPRELLLLGKQPDRAVASATGRTLRAVGLKRLKLRIPPG